MTRRPRALGKWLVPCEITLMALALVTPGRAVTVEFVTNGGFEDAGAHAASFSIGLDGALPNWGNTWSNPNKILDCEVFALATTNLCGTTAFGGGLQFYSGFRPGQSPLGGNYVTIDADASYESPLTQTITGLYVGNNYALTFYQAAAQQDTFSFPINNAQAPCLATGTSRCVDWQVTLGGTTKNSANMILPNHQDVPWQQQLMVFTATASTQVLSFLAVADVVAGSGLPPFALLDGVSLVQTTPEPESFGLIATGLLLIPFFGWLKKRRK